jgi:phosphomannomutase
MTLIKSISGIRGTIGGQPGSNLTPVDLVELSTAFAAWLKQRYSKPTIITGRDGRISGEVVSSLVISNLRMSGIDVVDLDLTSTPTVEMAVIHEKAQGGIIFSASHNPMKWNALKLLNEKGEFLTSEEGGEVLRLAGSDFLYAEAHQLGDLIKSDKYPALHIDKIMELPLIPVEEISKAGLRIVVDCINSSGAIVIPPLLDRLGVKYDLLNTEISGVFAHNPEPLEENLGTLMRAVKNSNASLGIAVDPDADRLALVDEKGNYFGEEYTLVAVADYILSRTPGPVVNNLSSSLALRDIAQKYDVDHFTSAVGEAHVVAQMKKVDAVIGGEGNGGVIDPNLHFGRDALVGIAYILSAMVFTKQKASELRARLPNYTISKQKVELEKGLDPDLLLEQLAEKYHHEEIDRTDGLKIYFDAEWVHMRKSNTEPIIRIYAESKHKIDADALALRFVKEISKI